MKRFTTLFMMMAMALTSFTLTSCDEDDDIAYTLEGTWSGNMYMSYSYNGHTYDAAYSEICFLRDPYTYSSGQGYWVDYYSNAPWDYVANHIDWKVSNGIIRVWFIEEDSYLEIEDYYLDDDYFTGTIYYGNQYVDFRLRHTSSPNWNNFDWGWGNDYDYYDYWSRAGNEAPAKEKPKRIIRVKSEE